MRRASDKLFARVFQVPSFRALSGSWILHFEPSLDPSLQALSGRLKSTTRRHTFNNDSLFQERKRRTAEEQKFEKQKDTSLKLPEP